MSTNKDLLTFLKEPHNLIECKAYTKTALRTNLTNVNNLRQLTKVYIHGWFALPNGSVKPIYKVGIRPDATRPRVPKVDTKETIQASILFMLPATAMEIRHYLNYKADVIALHLSDMVKSNLIHITNASKVMTSKAEPMYAAGKSDMDTSGLIDYNGLTLTDPLSAYARKGIVHQREGFEIKTTWRHK